MKSFCSPILSGLFCSLLYSSVATAQTLYWDSDGTTPGTTNERNTWDYSRPWWSTSAAGDIATQAWTAGATAVFSAGTNATGSTLVDIGVNLIAPTIYVEEGDITFYGAVYNGYFRDLSTIDVSSGASATLNVALYETGGTPVNFTKSGAGTLTILTDGINVHTTGTTTVSGGTFNIGNFTQLGDGSVTVSNGATIAALYDVPIDRVLTLTGTGSTLTSANQLNVGKTGTGTLNVLDGALLTRSSNDISIGNDVGSTGIVNVSGSGSTLTTGTDLIVGNFGSGELNISTGGRVVVDGTLWLGKESTGSGVLNLNTGGILAIGGSQPIQQGTGSATVNLAGGTIQVTGSDLTTSFGFNLIESTVSYFDTNGFNALLPSSLAGAGGLGKTGTGTLTMTEANTYTGDTVISGGTLLLSFDADSAGSVAGDIVNNASLVINRNGTSNFSNTISGTGSVTLTNLGTSTFTATNTYSGGTTLSGGTLNISSAANLGTGPVTVTAGSLNGTSTLDFNNDVTISGASGFTSAGVLTIGSSTGSAALTISSGATVIPKTSFVFGKEAGETGTATVTGAGSLLWGGGPPASINDPILGELSLGMSGTGVLTIEDNAIVRVPRINFGIYAGSSGTLHLNGGTLELYNTNSILQNTADAAIFANNGIIRIVGQSNAQVNKDVSTGIPIHIADGSTFTFDGSGRHVSMSGVISGGGSLIVGNTFNYLSGANTFSGTTTVSAGTLYPDNSLALQNSTVLTPSRITFRYLYSATFGGLSGSEHLYLESFNSVPLSLNVGNNNTDTTYTGILYGLGSFNKIGTGNLTLGGDNVHTGGTSINDGTLTLSHTGALGPTNGSVTLNGGTLNLGTFSPTVGTAIFNGGTFTNGTFDNAAAFEVRTGFLSASLGGSAALTKTGSGTFTLAGANTYAGATTVSNGTLQIAADSALGNAPGSATPGHLTLNGGTLATTATFTLNANRGIAFGGAGGTIETAATTTLSYSGIAAGLGSLTKTGEGNLVLSGANTYTGGTTVSAGTLTVGHANALGSTASVDVASGATLDLNDNSLTIADLDGAGNIALGSADLTTGDTNSHTLSGIISGTGSLTKTGSGSLTLSGPNTYSGGTTVSAGTLSVTTDANLGNTSGNVSVTAGATLSTGSNFATDRAITATGAGAQVGNNGELIIGNSATGSLTLNETASASTYNLNVGYNPTGNGTVNVNSGSTFNVSNETTLGRFGDATASVSITGTGSTFTSSGTYYLGWLGDATTTVASGGTLNTPVLSLAANGGSSGTLNLNTGGTLETAAITPGPGSVTFNFAGGTLRATDTLNTSVPATLTNASTVDTNGHATTLSGDLSGSGSLTKTGSGSLTLSGANTYSGGTTISTGTLSVTTDANLGNTSGNVSVTAGATLSTGSNFATDRAITATGAGAQVGNNGELIIGNSATGSLTLNDTASASAYNLNVGYNPTGNGTVNVNSGSTFTVGNETTLGRFGDATASVSITGTNSTFTGSGTYYLGWLGDATTTVASGGSLNTPALSLAANGGSSGILNLNTGGTLETAALTAGTGSATFNFAGGTLRATNTLNTSVPATLTNASTVDTNGHVTTLSGILSGIGSLTKTGSGTLTLTNANTYSGGTTISTGTLSVTTDANLGNTSGNVSVTAGATLSTGSNFATDRAITATGAGAQVGNNGELIIGNSATGSLTLNNTASASAYNLNVGYNPTGNGTVNVNSGSTFTVGNETTLGRFGDATATVNITGTNSTFTSSGTYYLGWLGDATTTVASGGSLTTPVLSLAANGGSSGILNLNTGGTLETAALTAGTGSATFNFAGGTLRATNTLNTSVSATLTNASTVDTNGHATTLSGALSGNGSLTKTGSGILTLTNANTYSGGTTVSDGTLLGNSSSLQGNITNNAAVTFNQASTGTYTGIISGNGSLTKTGAGTLVLTNTNTYSGGTTIDSGNLTLGAGAASGSVAGNITNNGMLTFNRSDDYTFGSVISGTGSVVNDGYIIRLSSAQTYTGQTTINSGYFVLPTTVDQGLSTSTTVHVASGAHLDISNRTLTIAGLTGAGQVYSFGGSSGHLTVNTADGQEQTFSGNIGVVGNNHFAITKIGDGSLTLSGTNIYTGGTTVSDGSLLGNSSSLQGNIINNAIVTFNQGTTGTYSGAISGTGALTKTGSGSLTLSGTNTWSGGTTVSAGTLSVTTDANLGNTAGNVSVTAGATLFTGGNFATDRAITATGAGAQVSNNGELIIGHSATGSLTLNDTASASTYNLNVGYNPTGNGTVNVNSGSTFTVGNETTLGRFGDASATVNITGTGSTFTSSGTYYLGWLGDATTTIASGGTLTTPTLSLAANGGSSGTLNLNTGGTLETAALTAGAGTATFNFSGGTLRATGALNTSVPAILTNASTVDTNGHATTLSGVLSGPGSLIKTGENTLTLSGPNTYTGSTTISGGTLSAATAANLSRGDINVSSGATLSITSFLETTTDLDISISGEGSTLQSAGRIWLNSTPGNIVNVSVTDGGALTAGSTFSIADQGFSSIGNITVDGTGSIASSNSTFYIGYQGLATATVGNGGLISAGDEIALATGSYSSGTLNLNTGGTLETAALTAGSGRATFNLAGGILRATNTLNTSVPATLTNASTVDTNGHATTLSGTLSGNGSLTKSGTGSLTLSGNNTYSGSTTVDGGTLHLGSANALGSTTSVDVASGSTLDLNGYSVTISDLDGTGNIELGSAALTTGDSNNHTFSGSINGFGSLVKTGTGTLVLSGHNNHSGGTTVSAGVIEFNNPSSFGSGTITLNGGGIRWASNNLTDLSSQLSPFNSLSGALDTNGNDVTFAHALSGTGRLTKAGTGTLTLAASSSLNQVAINGGSLALAHGAVLQIGGDNSLTHSNDGSLHLNNSTLRLGGDDFFSLVPTTLIGTAIFDSNGYNGGIYGPLSGNGSLTKTGSGILGVTNINTYTGGTTVTGGTLLVDTAADLGTGSVSVQAGASLAAATHLEFRTDVSASGTDAVIASPNHLEVGSAGDGTLAVSAGALVGSGTTTTLAYFESDTGTVTVSGEGSILYAQTGLRVGHGGNGTLTVDSGATANADHLILGTEASASGTFNLNEGGVLQVGGTDGISVGSGSGTFNLAGGTLRVGGDDRVASAPPPLSINLTDLPNEIGSVIAANTPQAGDTGLTTSVPMTLSNASTIDTNGSAATLSGELSGPGSLTKTGEGTLVLTGINAYVGGTSISLGTIVISDVGEGNSVLGTGDVSVGASGTLAGSGLVSGNTSVAGTLAPGNSPGEMTFAGDLTMESTATLIMEIAGSATRGTDYDAINVGGEIHFAGTLQILFLNDFTPQEGDIFDLFSFTTVTAGTFNIIDLPDLDTGLSWNTTTLHSLGNITVVPEPTTCALAASILILLSTILRKRLIQ